MSVMDEDADGADALAVGLFLGMLMRHGRTREQAREVVRRLGRAAENDDDWKVLADICEGPKTWRRRQ